MVDRYPEFAPERERKERALRELTERKWERDRRRDRAPSLAAHRHDRGGIAKLSTSSF